MSNGRETMASLRQKATEATDELARFKRIVRDEAISLGEQHNACDSGVNEFLDSVGLEKKTRDVVYTVTFNVYAESSDPEADLDELCDDLSDFVFKRDGVNDMDVSTSSWDEQ